MNSWWAGTLPHQALPKMLVRGQNSPALLDGFMVVGISHSPCTTMCGKLIEFLSKSFELRHELEGSTRAGVLEADNCVIFKSELEDFDAIVNYSSGPLQSAYPLRLLLDFVVGILHH